MKTTTGVADSEYYRQTRSEMGVKSIHVRSCYVQVAREKEHYDASGLLKGP